jgi:dTDP-glucose pyrophosphorylase/CBS domain-containing protein
VNLSAINALHIGLDTPLREVVSCIDRSAAMSIALLADADRRLINVITDGDVRRGLLAGLDLDAQAKQLLPIKAGMPNPEAITAPAGTATANLIALMQAHHVRQVPLLDALGRVVDIATLAELLPQSPQAISAVIMAGGFGTRLQPLTDTLPKPMLPVGGRPVMEWIVDQLRSSGIHRMKVSTHYLPEKIMEHFGDGSAFGVEMEYVNEDRPLGTGGVLGLLERHDEPMLVINGDVLTAIDFQKMHDFHQEHGADLTVALTLQQLEIPFGVVECVGTAVTGLREKPRVPVLVNAGIYLLQPSVHDFIPKGGERFNMTDLIQWLLDAGRKVVGFPIREYWTDIGQHQAYNQAQEEHRDGGRPW